MLLRVADAQADLSLRWAHKSFSHALAHLDCFIWQYKHKL